MCIIGQIKNIAYGANLPIGPSSNPNLGKRKTIIMGTKQHSSIKIP